MHHVIDDLLAVAVGNVEIDIGRRDALGIQEPLKHQPVFDGIYSRDAQRVSHQAAHRRPARACADARFLGKLHQIVQNQKIARISRLIDHVQLELQAFLMFRRHGFAPRFHTLVCQIFQIIAGRIIPRWQGKIGRVIFVKRNIQIAFFGYLERGFQNVRHIGK